MMNACCDIALFILDSVPGDSQGVLLLGALPPTEDVPQLVRCLCVMPGAVDCATPLQESEYGASLSLSLYIYIYTHICYMLIYIYMYIRVCMYIYIYIERERVGGRTLFSGMRPYLRLCCIEATSTTKVRFYCVLLYLEV